MVLWEPRADVFPSGMTPWPGLPLVLHNRMFSPHSAYHAMGFEFINEPGAWLALPIDKRMFTYIMGKAVAWGMTTYVPRTAYQRCAYLTTAYYPILAHRPLP